MKTAVVYYSMSGNTEYVAQRIAESVGADLIKIEPDKAYPDKGARKFLWGGKSAVMAETPPLLPYEFDGDKYGQVIFGFPVWAGNVTPPLRTFIRDNREALKGKRVAAFACQSGSGAEKAFGKLAACLGLEALAAIGRHDIHRSVGERGTALRRRQSRLGGETRACQRGGGEKRRRYRNGRGHFAPFRFQSRTPSFFHLPWTLYQK